MIDSHYSLLTERTHKSELKEHRRHVLFYELFLKVSMQVYLLSSFCALAWLIYWMKDVAESGGLLLSKWGFLFKKQAKGRSSKKIFFPKSCKLLSQQILPIPLGNSLRNWTQPIWRSYVYGKGLKMLHRLKTEKESSSITIMLILGQHYWLKIS